MNITLGLLPSTYAASARPTLEELKVCSLSESTRMESTDWLMYLNGDEFLINKSLDKLKKNKIWIWIRNIIKILLRGTIENRILRGKYSVLFDRLASQVIS